MKKAPKVVVVADFDGTLTPQRYGSQWSVLEQVLFTGELRAEADALRARYMSKFTNGTITPEEEHQWYIESVEMYFRAGLTPETLVRAMSTLALRPGVIDFLHALQARGIPFAIISYGKAQAIEAVLHHHGVSHKVDTVYSGRLTTHSGRFVGVDQSTVVLPKDKGAWSQAFAKKNGVPYERIIAVGDSAGDATLGHLAEHRIGISDTPEAVEKLHRTSAFGMVIHLSQEDFSVVAQMILRKIEELEK